MPAFSIHGTIISAERDRTSEGEEIMNKENG
jgi:hypothetical protein